MDSLISEGARTSSRSKRARASIEASTVNSSFPRITQARLWHVPCLSSTGEPPLLRCRRCPGWAADISYKDWQKNCWRAARNSSGAIKWFETARESGDALRWTTVGRRRKLIKRRRPTRRLAQCGGRPSGSTRALNMARAWRPTVLAAAFIRRVGRSSATIRSITATHEKNARQHQKSNLKKIRETKRVAANLSMSASATRAAELFALGAPRGGCRHPAGRANATGHAFAA